MAQQLPAGGRPDPLPSERLPHHISSIAHLFFAEGETTDPVSATDTTRDFIVTCFNESRISAFACAGLVTGARTLMDTSAEWGVSLVEDSSVSWSTVAFLPHDPSGPEGCPVAVESQPSRWSWQPKSNRATASAWVRWTHLEVPGNDRLTDAEPQQSTENQAAGSVDYPQPPTKPHTLVVCLLAREMGQWEMAFKLGRLLGLLEPQQLEILVFPDSWAQDTKPEWGLRRWQDREKGASSDLLTKCRSLTRAIGGACQVTITALPASEKSGGNLTPDLILQKIATRLTADF